MNILKLCGLGLAISSAMPLATYSQKLSAPITQKGAVIHNSRFHNNLTNDVFNLSATYTNKVSNLTHKTMTGKIHLTDKIADTNKVIRLK